jgi:hypothetical protein
MWLPASEVLSTFTPRSAARITQSEIRDRVAAGPTRLPPTKPPPTAALDSAKPHPGYGLRVEPVDELIEAGIGTR